MDEITTLVHQMKFETDYMEIIDLRYDVQHPPEVEAASQTPPPGSAVHCFTQSHARIE